MRIMRIRRNPLTNIVESIYIRIRKRLERESLAADLTCYQRTKPGERTQIQQNQLLHEVPRDSPFLNSRATPPSGPLSSRVAPEGSWLELRPQTRVAARSEIQPDHAGEHHRADSPSRTHSRQKQPLRQRFPRRQARLLCAKTFSECLPARRPRPCAARSPGIFARLYKPTSRKFRWKPGAPPVQRIRLPGPRKNAVKPMTDRGCHP